jgi:2'-5' RNA ligase
MTKTSPVSRVFVAITVPSQIREEIMGIVSNLRDVSRNDVRWITEQYLHITLKFFGEVKAEKLPAMRLALREASSRHSPFSIELASIGTFGGREGLRVMWVSVAGQILRLEALQNDMNVAYSVLDFEKDQRPFKPHLTLGRVNDKVSTRRRAELEVAIGKVEMPDLVWHINAVSLIKSTLTSAGPTYEIIETVDLIPPHPDR